jgi:ATP-dependent helicase/nuclease subunit B
VSGKIFSEIDAWLREGGVVVTASERAARSLMAEYHRVRRTEGLTAWPTPNIREWRAFVQAAWEERSLDGRVILNTLQEQSLWREIFASRLQSATLLEESRHRLAQMALEAHQLLCAHAPKFLNVRQRVGWQQDTAEFSAWLAEFDEICSSERLISAARLPLELTAQLEGEASARPPILLVGFDRISPTQRRLFSAMSKSGIIREATLGKAAAHVEFHEAVDQANELAACAIWCRRQLGANPQARMLVVAQDAAKRRGEFERAFLRYARSVQGSAAPSLIEFTLGLPLGQIGLARRASLLLRWLSGPLEEHKIDWLFCTGCAGANSDESRSQTAFMRAMRHKGWQRPRWTLADFLRQRPGVNLPAAWVSRMSQAQIMLSEFARRLQSSRAWAEFVPKLLRQCGWPGERALSSIEFQAFDRWQRVVDSCASLGFGGRLMSWIEFLDTLERTADETLFAPESEDAPILIAGPAESAGLTADAIWFLGANEDAWPARGATHPLLPLGVQRETAMPHATPHVDWELASAMTKRIVASVQKVHFSYARQTDGVDVRPSRLIAQIAGPPQQLGADFAPEALPAPIAVSLTDASRIPFPAHEPVGGATILTSQSQCAFKAFATVRLGAEGWEAAEAGLTAAERGLLLHDVMHRVWAGPPDGIRSYEQLMAIADLESFVAGHVQHALRDKIPTRARESMPQRYLELEEKRLTRLVTNWLRFEQSRAPFTVEETEVKANTTISDLELRLRLDRVDRLNDGSLLVIDYKSGAVTPKAWELPRPDDVQLPLYAAFGIDRGLGEVGGLVFAKIRPGDQSEFAGRTTNARETITPSLGANSSLVKKPLKSKDMVAWREEIEELARDFVAGRAAVDPREYPTTCERCGLQALCRVQEMQFALAEVEEAENDEADDE